MKRVVSIDGIMFDYPLHLSENFECDNFIGEQLITTGGNLKQNIIDKGKMTKKVIIFSYDSGWISFKTKEKLLKNIDDNQKKIVFNDDSSSIYYYDLKNPIEIDPLFEGANWYKIKINLLKKD